MMDALSKNHGFQHFKLQGSDYGGCILVLGEQGARLSLHFTHSITTGSDTPRLEDGRGSILFHWFRVLRCNFKSKSKEIGE
ncbi:unnamed protein product [Urochloa humidicola]